MPAPGVALPCWPELGRDGGPGATGHVGIASRGRVGRRMASSWTGLAPRRVFSRERALMRLREQAALVAWIQKSRRESRRFSGRDRAGGVGVVAAVVDDVNLNVIVWSAHAATQATQRCIDTLWAAVRKLSGPSLWWLSTPWGAQR